MFFGQSSITEQILLHCIARQALHIAQMDCNVLCICLEELILVNKSEGPPSFPAFNILKKKQCLLRRTFRGERMRNERN